MGDFGSEAEEEDVIFLFNRCVSLFDEGFNDAGIIIFINYY